MSERRVPLASSSSCLRQPEGFLVVLRSGLGLTTQPTSLPPLPASCLKLPGQAWGPTGCWLIAFLLLVAFWEKGGPCTGVS